MEIAYIRAIAILVFFCEVRNMFFILCMLLSARGNYADLKVKGHIEMGQSIARLFNDIVEQFSPSPPTSQLTGLGYYKPVPTAAINFNQDFTLNSKPAVHQQESGYENQKLNEELMKMDAAWTTGTNIKDLEEILNLQNPQPEVKVDQEVPLLEQMMRDSALPAIVHLYGHHRHDTHTDTRNPKNNINI